MLSQVCPTISLYKFTYLESHIIIQKSSTCLKIGTSQKLTTKQNLRKGHEDLGPQLLVLPLMPALSLFFCLPETCLHVK